MGICQPEIPRNLSQKCLRTICPRITPSTPACSRHPSLFRGLVYDSTEGKPAMTTAMPDIHIPSPWEPSVPAGTTDPSGTATPARIKIHQSAAQGGSGCLQNHHLTKSKNTTATTDPAFPAGRPKFRISGGQPEATLDHLQCGRTLPSVARNLNTPPHETQEACNYVKPMVTDDFC